MRIHCCIWFQWCEKLRLFEIHLLRWLCFIFAMLIFSSSEIQAETYRYMGNMPAAKMTLDMMEMMGYIQRVPDSSYGGGIPSWPMPGLNGLPYNMGMQIPLNGMSSWPGVAANSMSTGGNLNPRSVASNGPQPGAGSIHVRPDDLAALLNAVQRPVDPSVSNTPPIAELNESNPSSVTTIDRPPIATGSANTDLMEGGLSGVWLGNNQDVLVVTGQRFIWTDKDARSIEGEIRIQGDTLLTRLKSSGTVMAYRFELGGDKFTAMTDTGYQYIFRRSE